MLFNIANSVDIGSYTNIVFATEHSISPWYSANNNVTLKHTNRFKNVAKKKVLSHQEVELRVSSYVSSWTN